MTDGNPFIREQHGSFTTYRAEPSDEDHADLDGVFHALLSDPDRILKDGQILKDDRKTSAARVELCGRTFFLKRYHCKTCRDQFKSIFRRSRAVRAWAVTRQWKLRDLPVPMPLICMEERSFRILKRSYLLSEFIENGKRLTNVWPGLDDNGKRVLLAQLADVFGRIHRVGGFHGDLKWNNILVRTENSKERIILCDMDASRLFAGIRPTRARKDIERFLRDLDRREGNEVYRNSFLRSWERWVKSKEGFPC